MSLRAPILVIAILTFAFSAGARGQQESQNLPSPPSDPTDFGSPRLDPALFDLVRRGAVTGIITSTYFNAWRGSWHTARIHTELGRIGQRFTTDETSILESRHGEDTIYRIDLEGIRSDVLLRYGLTESTSLSFRAAHYTVGAPHWDRFVEEFHDSFGLSTDARDIVSRGESLFYVYSSDGRVELRDEQLNGNRFGDIEIAATTRVSRILGGEQTATGTIDFTPGNRGLGSSGGVDGGIRVASSWRGPRFHSTTGLGYTWLNRDGTLLGLPRSNTWHVLAAAGAAVTKRTAIQARFRLDESPLGELRESNLGQASLTYAIALKHDIAHGVFAGVEIVEDVSQVGVAADWSLQISVGLAP